MRLRAYGGPPIDLDPDVPRRWGKPAGPKSCLIWSFYAVIAAFEGQTVEIETCFQSNQSKSGPNV